MCLSMNNLQKLMADIYLKKDQQRGLEKTVLWLVSEIGEISEVIAKNGSVINNPKTKQALKLELADGLAWLLSVANLVEIDIEEAFYEKYPHACPRCLKNPCQCK